MKSLTYLDWKITTVGRVLEHIKDLLISNNWFGYEEILNKISSILLDDFIRLSTTSDIDISSFIEKQLSQITTSRSRAIGQELFSFIFQRYNTLDDAVRTSRYRLICYSSNDLYIAASFDASDDRSAFDFLVDQIGEELASGKNIIFCKLECLECDNTHDVSNEFYEFACGCFGHIEWRYTNINIIVM